MGGNEDDNTFNILIATDIHLGYNEKDAVRGNDSFIAFEEILQHAQQRNVDFILLGGDLFHENKPSRNTIHACMVLFRKYCMSDKPCHFEFLSDQSVNFSESQFPIVNYEDPNINVGIPVFTIHGNHDDPAGLGNLCAVDMLSACGFINYFGRSRSLHSIEMSPLLMQKGGTRLALYGLGSIRDERLHRLFLSKAVTMLRPKEDMDDWFSLLLFHQNRAKHGAKNFIPEKFLDDFLDLVIWGHEHECRIDPEWNSEQKYYISQPGSPIATSLSEGESVKKYIGILKIKGKDFKISKIPLETVRPFIMEDLMLSKTSIDPDDPNSAKKAEDYCAEKIEEMIEKAQKQLITGHPKQPTQPLIRLRVDYSGGYETFHTYRFSQQFVSRVANPNEIVHFMHKRQGKKGSEDDFSAENDIAEMLNEGLEIGRVEDVVKEFFSRADEKSRLKLLTERGLGSAVKEFVEKDERDAISELVKYQIQKTQDYLKQNVSQIIEKETIASAVEKFRKDRKTHGTNQTEDDAAAEVSEALSQARLASRSHSATAELDDALSWDESEPVQKPSQKRGRGGGRARGRGRAAKQPVISHASDAPVRKNSRTSTRLKKDLPLFGVNRKKVGARDSSSDNELFDPFGGCSTTQRQSTQSTSTSVKPKRSIFEESSDEETEQPSRMTKRRRR